MGGGGVGVGARACYKVEWPELPEFTARAGRGGVKGGGVGLSVAALRPV